MNLIVLCVLFVFNDDYFAWIWVNVPHKEGLFIQPQVARFAPPGPKPHPDFYHVVAGWCVSFLNTPAVLRLKDGGGRLGVGGWSAAVVIT